MRDGMDVLDCGCGPGRLIELLTTEFESLRLTGLEVDPTLVSAAKGYLATVGLDDVDIVQGSAEHPNLPPASFDFIVMRLVLEHVVDPLAALRELKKLLRPGGRIAVISNDFAFHLRTWPEVRELDDLYDAYIASRRADGGDPCIGRRVPDVLRQAGFRLAGFEVEVAHNHIEGDPPFLLAEGAGIPAQLVQSGYLDEAVFERLVAAWKVMLEHPDHTIMRPLFIAVGENSDEEDVTSETTLTVVPSTTPADHLEYIAPTTDREQDITEVWADVIGLERVGVNQNFFDLGGTSLMLEHVQVRLEALLGRELPLTLLFQHPTVASLASNLDQAPPADDRPAPAPTELDTLSTDAYLAQSPRPNSGESVSRQAQQRRDALMRRRPPNE